MKIVFYLCCSYFLKEKEVYEIPEKDIKERVSFSKKGTEGPVNGFEYLAGKPKSPSQNIKSKRKILQCDEIR